MLSRADLSLPTVAVSASSLNAGRDLTWLEMQSFCFDLTSPHDATGCGAPFNVDKNVGPDRDLLPTGMKKARLALCAHIAVWTFPVTVVKVGIAANGQGTMSLSWNQNGNGPRRTSSVQLNGYEIDHLLAALNKSSFWQLPRVASRMGIADGEVATVEVSLSGRKHNVTNFVGDEDAVDLSILVHALSTIILRHWQQVPVI